MSVPSVLYWSLISRLCPMSYVLCPMRTFLRLKHRSATRLPTEFRDQDLRYPPELVALFVQRYSHTGDLVFDPFAGYGTSLIVAEQLGRRAVGIELDERRVAYIRSQLRDPAAIIHGDTRHLGNYPTPLFDLSITSPPFTERGDTDDALANYTVPSHGYRAYLNDLRAIYAIIRSRMKPGAHAILEVANLKGPRGVTTLAWDIARTIGEVLHFEGEVVIGWDTYAYGYDHSYCLVFSHGHKIEDIEL